MRRTQWQVELFCKALKQFLQVKTFVGTEANALNRIIANRPHLFPELLSKLPARLTR